LASEQKQLQQSVEQFQASVTAAQGKAMQDFMTLINNTVKTISQKQQLDMVLLKPAVVYADNTVDITNDVMAQLPK
jgi:Skp family chaperone for outer membrane proteins